MAHSFMDRGEHNFGSIPNKRCRNNTIDCHRVWKCGMEVSGWFGNNKILYDPRSNFKNRRFEEIKVCEQARVFARYKTNKFIRNDLLLSKEHYKRDGESISRSLVGLNSFSETACRNSRRKQIHTLEPRNHSYRR